MKTQEFIEFLERMIDQWPGESIVAEEFIEALEQHFSKTDIESFVNDYGGCCLECSLNEYFRQSDDYDEIVEKQ